MILESTVVWDHLAVQEGVMAMGQQACHMLLVMDSLQEPARDTTSDERNRQTQNPITNRVLCLSCVTIIDQLFQLLTTTLLTVQRWGDGRSVSLYSCYSLVGVASIIYPNISVVQLPCTALLLCSVTY